jgi:hypothetical protein
MPGIRNGQENPLKAVHIVHPKARVPLCQNQQALFMAVLTDDAGKATCKTCLRIFNARESK